MTIDVVCQHCGKQMRAPAQHVGRTVKCPGCKGDLVIAAVPEVGEEEPTIAITTKPKTSTKQAAAQSTAINTPAIKTPGKAPVAKAPAIATGGNGRAAAPVQQPAVQAAVVMPAAAKVAAPVVAAPPKKTAPAAKQAPALVAPAVADWHMMTGDGEEYGPVSRAELETWLADGRVDSGCQLLQDGWPQWKWADEVFPQLAAATASTGALDLDATPLVTPVAVVAAPPPAVPEIPSFPPLSGKRVGPPTLPGGNPFAGLGAAPPPMANDNPFAAAVVEDEAHHRARGAHTGGAPAHTGDIGWFSLYTGLGTVNLTLYIALAGYSLFSIALIIELTGGITSEGMAKTMLMMLFWGLIIFSGGMFATLAGWHVCCSLPRRARTHGILMGAMASAGGFFLGLLLLTLTLVWAMAMGPRASSGEVLANISLGLMYLGATGALVLYAFFLSGTMRAIGGRNIQTQAMAYAGMMVVLTIWILVAVLAIKPSSKPMAWAMVLSQITQGIAGLLWLALMNGNLRKTLKMHRPWEGG